MRFLLAIAVMLAVFAGPERAAFSQMSVVYPCGMYPPTEPSQPFKPEFNSCEGSRTAEIMARCQTRLQKTQDKYREKLNEYQAEFAKYQEKKAAFDSCTAQQKTNDEAKRQETARKNAEDAAKRKDFERQITPAVQAVVDKFSARGQVQLQGNYSAFWLVATKSDDMLGDLQAICKIIARHDYIAKYRQYNPSGPKVRAVINVGSLLGPRQEIGCE